MDTILTPPITHPLPSKGQSKMVREKSYIVALCQGTEELHSCRVEVDSYTKAGARDDLIAGRATLYRAIEKAMEAYARYCRKNDEEMREVTSVIASYQGERA